jgi:hypothetical protein
LIEGFETSDLFSTVGMVEWDAPSLKTLVNRMKEKWNYQNAEELALHLICKGQTSSSMVGSLMRNMAAIKG